MVEDLGKWPFKFYIVESFHNLLVEATEREGQLVYKGDKTTLDFFSGNTSFEQLSTTAHRIDELDITVFDASDYWGEENSEIYNNLSLTLPNSEPQDDYESAYQPGGFRLADVLFEEVIFGLNMSPILARMKKVINRISEAADYRVELSQEYLQKYIDESVEEVSERRQTVYKEIRRLERRSRIRHEQEPDEPVRKIAVLRELVKDYPGTNWISYLLKTSPTAVGATAGAAFAGIQGAMLGAGATGVIGHYFADP
ncbi:hypothetical protein [Halovivax ruber]|nr:hypothetical protein [Halovivax ruber]